MVLPRTLAMALALLCASHPPLAVRAQIVSNELELLRLQQQLRQVWLQEPLTAQRPFPALQRVAGPGDPPCTGPFSAAAPLLQVCAAGGEIRLDGQQLAALQQMFGEGGVAFALAYGLGLSLVPPQPPGAPGPQATAGLQAACAAGSLLGRLPQAQRQAWIGQALNAAAEAYDSAAAGQLGTGPQRAYALASGLGATGLPCDSAAMAHLASGALDTEAAQLQRNRGLSVGLDILCRQPPACPRRLGL
jgi:hypothetical protein